jgi:sporulation protein YlmC with PRC-barrel domain
MNGVTLLSIKSTDLRWRKVICEDLTVGEVKEVIIDPSTWKVTHLEVNLSKEAAELAFGTRKGGIRNLLAVSAIGKTGKTIDLKVKKGQLQIYLKPPKSKP